MPKPMTMIIDVEEVAFGRVFRTLNAMPGVIEIKLDATPKPKTPKAAVAVRGGTSQELVLRALAAGPLDKAALTKAMTDGGKKPASLPDTLQRLRKRKLMTGGAAQGGYKLTKAGLSAATEEEKA